jgi:hypothetical protein
VAPGSPFEAPTKHLTFVNGRTAGDAIGLYFQIDTVVYVDVKRDGRLETIAQIARVGQGRVMQVAAFTRDSSGAIVPFGQVVVARPNTEGAVQTIDGLRAEGDQVGVRVGDQVPCCGVMPAEVQYQWRSYGWTGTAFQQTGGPTQFGPDVRFPDIVLGPATAKLGAPVDGVRHGTLTVTVSSRHSVAVTRMSLLIRMRDTGLTPQPPGWDGIVVRDPRFPVDLYGAVTPPPLGGSVVLRFGISRPVGQDAAAAAIRIQGWPQDKDGNQVKDAWSADNRLAVPVTVAT